jgi:hypothetical protein
MTLWSRFQPVVFGYMSVSLKPTFLAISTLLSLKAKQYFNIAQKT